MSVEATINGILEGVGLTIYGVRAPDDVLYPYSTFSKISGGRVYSHNGYSKIARPRFQIECYDRTYNGAKTVAAAVTEAIEQQLPGSQLVGDFDDEFNGTYRIAQDYFINYKEDLL